MSERSLKWIEALDDNSFHKRWIYKQNSISSPDVEDGDCPMLLGPAYDLPDNEYNLVCAKTDLKRATIGHNMLPLFCELVRQVESDAKVLGVSGETSALLDLIHKAMDMEVENVANV